MQKPICLITGATEGVGRATALELARQGFAVTMMARDPAKAEAVRRDMQASAGGAEPEILIGDLQSLNDVRRVAETFKQKNSRLDVLINNAGIVAPSRAVTKDGYETSYQVNYLSHFLLTQLLRDELQRSEQGRIINLSSSAYSFGKFDPSNLQGESSFSSIGAYAASKLMMLLFTIELAARLRGTQITANAVHPGVVRTHMLSSAQGLFKIISYLALPFSVSAETGAATSVYLARSGEVAGVSGGYFVKSKPAKVASKFNTSAHRELLWRITEDQLRKS